MTSDWLAEHRAKQAAKRAFAEAEAQAIRECPLVSPDGLLAQRGKLRRVCWMCGSPLPPRRQKWCSDACAVGPNGWFTLHEWARASYWAVIRDGGRCRRCGDRAGARRRCYVVWGKDLTEQCWDPWCPNTHITVVGRLQVDHIVPRPRNGYTYARSCGHHPAGLQTLCVPCHAIKGVVYRAMTAAIERASLLALPSGPTPVQLTLHEALQLSLDIEAL